MMRLASCRDEHVTLGTKGIAREVRRPLEPLNARPPACCVQSLGHHFSPLIPHSLLLTSCLLLAACGTQAPKSVVDSDNVSTQKPAAEAPPVARKRGGYYLDDGPEDYPPEGLDAIPDAQPRFEPLHRFANKPYSAFGKDYFPSSGLKAYRARGRASWYGKRFHGAKTSSGEIYDMYAMTAAHPTLPIPSYARVTHVSSGKSVVVRINDRGPFHTNRLIDLSYVAARRLGYLNDGSATVEVESIIPGDSSVAQSWPPKLDAMHERTPNAPMSTPAQAQPAVAAASQDQADQRASDDPIASFAASSASEAGGSAPRPGTPPGGVYLQLGAFSNNVKAESFRARVLRDLAWLGEKMLIVLTDGTFRLHVGPYPSAKEAARIAERIKSALDLKPLLIQR